MDYPLEHLDPERFQKVCQALLLDEFPNALFLPVGQEDGGRDAFTSRLRQRTRRKSRVIFQMKFIRDPSTLPDARARRKWVLDAINNELPNIKALVSEGADHYRLITNVRGSGARKKGSVDKMAQLLDGLPIPADAWWRDDLISRLDNAWDLKWHYPELLTGPDLLRGLVLRAGQEPDAARRSSTIRAFLEQERRSDDTVKFKQVGLENSLLDLFVDLPLISARLDSRSDHRIAKALAVVAAEYADNASQDPALGNYVIDGEPIGRWRDTVPAPAAAFLLHDSSLNLAPRLVIEGAPGQGKSTVSQYLCQVHRCRLLNSEDLARIPAKHQTGGVRLPFRIDLRDLAAWLHGRNPFGSDDDGSLTTKRTLETFLSAQIEMSSGGAAFSVSDLHALARESSVLLALDGLDEVADIAERERVVNESSAAIGRIERLALSLQVVVTSRPAALELAWLCS